MPEIDPRMLGTGYARQAGDVLQQRNNVLQQILSQGAEAQQMPMQAPPPQPVKAEDAIQSMLFLLFKGLWDRTQNANTQQQ